MIDHRVIYIPLIAGILIPIALFLWAWPRRKSSEIVSFQLLMGAVAIWSFFYLLEFSSDDLAIKGLWGRCKYLGVVTFPVLGFSFVCQYIGKERWITSRNFFFLFSIPLITLILIWTNDAHGLFWKKIGWETKGDITVQVSLSGPWFWVHIGYSYSLLLTGSLLLLNQTVRSNHLYRGQMLAVLIAVGAPLAGKALYTFGKSFFSLIDLTPFGLAVTGIAMVYGLLRYKMLDITPFAHDLLFKNMSDAVFVLDQQNRVVDLNDRAQQILGINSLNAIGKSAHQVFSPWAEFMNRYIATDDLNSEICVAVSGSPEYFDLLISPLLNARGILAGRLMVLRDITSRKQVERDLHGIQNNLETLVHQRTLELQVANQRLTEEIKERRRTQVILKESEERYRQLVEQPFDGVYVHRGGNIIYVNQTGAKILGAEKANEIIGMSILDFIHPECKKFVEKRIRAISEGEKMVPLAEERFIRLDGKEIDVEVAGTLLIYEGLASIMVVFRDITDRKLAESRLRLAHEELEERVKERTADLEKSNLLLQIEIAEREKVEEELRKAKEFAETASRSKSDFLANMSHELRTPLNAIIGFSELLLDREFGELNPVQGEYLGDVLQSSRHLLSLISDILDLSKVEAGKMELEVKGVPLRELLEGSLVMVKEKALKHGIELSTELDGIPEVLEADERKLKQVIFNLLSNAVKFTPDGGRVVVRGTLLSRQDGRGGSAGEGREQAVGHNGSEVLISVEDTGIGIQGEDLERIFSPFEQVEGSANRRYQGTGLGLSLSRRIVELHGGTIWAESAGLGKGSTFRFLIPFVPSGREKDDR